MKKRFPLAPLCIAALVACASPGSDTAFKAPTGWNSTPGIMGRFQMWMNGGQILMLVRGDAKMSLRDAEKSVPGSADMRDYKHSRITICGGQQADYFTGRGQSKMGGKSTPSIIEGIVSDIADSRYFTMYVRPLGVKPDSQAETALHSICKK